MQNGVRDEDPHGVVRTIHVSLQVQSHSDILNGLLQGHRSALLKSAWTQTTLKQLKSGTRLRIA